MDEARKAALDDLLKAGIDPFPYSFGRTHSAAQIHGNYASLEGKAASIAGRIVMKRSFGKLVFATVQDASGRIQVLLREDHAGAKKLADFEKLMTGDIIGATGTATKTKKGEVSIDATEFAVLSKSLRPMPEKFHGLEDTETRYRQRYLDLIANPDVVEIFKKRAAIIRTIREYLDENGFLEVETPVLQPIYGGGAAKPFVTRHNALKADLYLRIADELYLKRLIVGGMERVYEISKDFRNEDIDSTHNPEFTMLEFYEAYTDYHGMMRRAQDIFLRVCNAVHGKDSTEFKGKPISFAPPFAILSLVGEIKAKTGIDVLCWKDDAEAMAAISKLGLKATSQPTRAHAIDALFDEFVKPGITDPSFVIDYPEFMCPLAKKKRGDARLAERFELFIAGEECANAYSEITNPVQQRAKFNEQADARRNGDQEAQPFDEDFVTAMEYGMPPMGGIGIGIDRITMIFTGKESIKEVILFPSMRPLGKAPKAAAEKTGNPAGKQPSGGNAPDGTTPHA
ncbi:MAG: lysine--tRNA ligase [Candidatus Micrarchaeota archaeon]